MTFTQPVSMICSKEQYERDLKGPLLAMGYDERNLSNFISFPLLVTNQGSWKGRLANLLVENKDAYNRYFIKEYNPELFLALAGMTDNPNGNIGEWWKFIDIDNAYGFVVNDLYKQIGPLEKSGPFQNKFGNPDGFVLSCFTKPTKQEIINHFTKKINKQMDKVIVKKSDFKKLYDLACYDWKTKFDELLKPFMFSDTIEFDNPLIRIMQRACTAEQLKVFKEIFKEIDKNPFVKSFNPTDIQKTSETLFGKKYLMEIATGSTDKNAFNKPELYGKALYFSDEVEVITHTSPKYNGTLVELKYK